MIKSGQQQSAKNLFQDYLIKAQRALVEAQKDNDFIYHERIPDLKALNPIPRATIAKPTPMPHHLSTNFQGSFDDIILFCGYTITIPPSLQICFMTLHLW